MVEHLVPNQKVASSSLVARSISCWFPAGCACAPRDFLCATVAQLVEPHPSKVRVAGSSPVGRSIFLGNQVVFSMGLSSVGRASLSHGEGQRFEPVSPNHSGLRAQPFCCGVEQPAVRRPHKPKVTGSSPVPATTFASRPRRCSSVGRAPDS